MNKEEVTKNQKAILEKLDGELKVLKNDVTYIKQDEAHPTDMLVVEYSDVGIANDDVLAQYYFLPVMLEETETENFMIIMTISDELEGDSKKLQMLQAVNFVNFLLPSGAFTFNPTLEVLSYKRSAIFAVDTDETEKYAMIGYEMTFAMSIVARFTAPLLAFMNDDITWEEFQQACNSVSRD